ncbi:hypothetical protein D3C80_1128690 [compost metagenome]
MPYFVKSDRFVPKTTTSKLKTKRITMKKFFAYAAMAALLAVVIASCGSSRGHCDAYGSVDNTENADLASK